LRGRAALRDEALGVRARARQMQGRKESNLHHPFSAAGRTVLRARDRRQRLSSPSSPATGGQSSRSAAATTCAMVIILASRAATEFNGSKERLASRGPQTWHSRCRLPLDVVPHGRHGPARQRQGWWCRCCTARAGQAPMHGMISCPESARDFDGSLRPGFVNCSCLPVVVVVRSEPLDSIDHHVMYSWRNVHCPGGRHGHTSAHCVALTLPVLSNGQ
jgi:hypothetical protein